MKRLVVFTLCVLFASTVTLADPVKVVTYADPVQDDWALDGWVEELSTAPHNALDQLIISQQVPWGGHMPCPQDYGDWGYANVQVAITNMTNRYFEDLYYVADGHDSGIETSFTNLDEWVADMTPANAPWHVPLLAFKIDAVGLNTPLVFESLTPDQIFEPGETWEFVIQEYHNKFGLPPSALGSVSPTAPFGAIAQASWFGQDPAGLSSGSIITPDVIPAPAAILLGSIGVGLVGWLRRRRSL